MIHCRRWRGRAFVTVASLALVAGGLVVSGVMSPASAATKTLYIPSGWASTGEVPWSTDRTRESTNFILLWGEKSGTNPVSAPSPYNFNPDDILGQLEKLYSFYVNTMRFTPETGYLAQYKINVIITRTWNRTALDAWATGGSVDGRVGVINIAPAAAQPNSWGLAHELAHVFQCYTFLGRSGFGFTDASAGSFWETSAEFMTMQVYPDAGAGDLTRFLRTENLYFSSSRHHYGNWMLVQYIVDHHGGVEMFNRIWNEAKAGEHPLETYRRINNLTQQQLAAQLGEYAQHQVTYDYSNRGHFMPFVNNVYGAGFINAYNGVPVTAINSATGHYAIADAMAPSDFGYNKIRLVPASDGALIRLHFKGHVNSAASSGWSYGFVAVAGGTPRYGPVYTAADGEISFQTQPGEKDVYLVVLGAPGVVHHYAFLDGFPKNYRYPYEFRVGGATPSGYEPGYAKPAATGGGHWHSNGGGWVDNRASVASTAYVGPRAAVYGSSTVSGTARIEGLAWVNSGATVTGNAVVRDNALVQGGANLSGGVVVGGDAEPSSACGSGTYLMFSDARGCDGGAGEADVNPGYSAFPDEQLAITGVTTPPTPSTSPTASPTRTVSPTPTASPTATTVPTSNPPTRTGSPSPTGTVSGACTAAYKIINQWPGGFQGEVTVTAGVSTVNGWTVSWSYADGQTITQAWNATVVANGGTVTARPVTWNGVLAAGASTSFGFIGTAGTTNRSPSVTCAAG